ncbi:uncharacterized protein TNCV_1523151 [Trichonephila clavipes]|nr:uncharacterized protein TNCV_1523151 [Trichonephila clavipes]
MHAYDFQIFDFAAGIELITLGLRSGRSGMKRKVKLDVSYKSGSSTAVNLLPRGVEMTMKKLFTLFPSSFCFSITKTHRDQRDKNLGALAEDSRNPSNPGNFFAAFGVCCSTCQTAKRRGIDLRFASEVFGENGTWRKRSDFELYHSYKESDIVNFIKTQRIKWAGHVVRMDENRPTKKLFNAQPIGTRRKGRPNLRWMVGLEKNLLVLRTKNWRTLAGRRLAWKMLLGKDKAHPGLSSHSGRKERVKYTNSFKRTISKLTVKHKI